MNVIEADQLTRRFGKFTAVDHISLQVKEGEILGFLGPNGAGKSTTIRMLCTLLRPTEGTARVAGFDIVREADKVRKQIGLVAEKLILYDRLTAEENLILFGRLNNLPEPKIREGIDKWLSRLHMTQWQKHQVGSYSTGMKQRINIARALLHHPHILFLDEPTLGLDPQTTRVIHDFVVELGQEGMTIVLTTHDMNEAASLSQRVAIVDQAKIVAMDTTSNLKRSLMVDDTTIIDMEIPNLDEPMVARLKAADFVTSVVRTDTFGVRVHARGSASVSRVVDTVVAGGGNIRAINTVEPSLQDVFLHLTGHEMRDQIGKTIPSAGVRGSPPRGSRVR